MNTVILWKIGRCQWGNQRP